MDREVPFDPGAKCDLCDNLGAFDFMGDYICEECGIKISKSNRILSKSVMRRIKIQKKNEAT